MLRSLRIAASACAVALLTMLAVAVPGASASSAPDATPVVFVHGFYAERCPDGLNVASALIGPTFELRAAGWAGPLDVVSYYACDRSGSAIGADTPNTSIRRIGAQLARYIYRKYTAQGQPVDIVAHSMGGLIARTAIELTAHHLRGFPPALRVDRVVTFSTPFAGISRAAIRAVSGLAGTRQARQVRAGSRFLRSLASRGVAPGTDWLAIGSSGGCDLVPGTSAVDVPHALRLRYAGCWSHTQYLYNRTATRSFAAYRDGVPTTAYAPLKQMSRFLAKP